MRREHHPRDVYHSGPSQRQGGFDLRFEALCMQIDFLSTSSTGPERTAGTYTIIMTTSPRNRQSRPSGMHTTTVPQGGETRMGALPRSLTRERSGAGSTGW